MPTIALRGTTYALRRTPHERRRTGLVADRLRRDGAERSRRSRTAARISARGTATSLNAADVSDCWLPGGPAGNRFWCLISSSGRWLRGATRGGREHADIRSDPPGGRSFFVTRAYGVISQVFVIGPAWLADERMRSLVCRTAPKEEYLSVGGAPIPRPTIARHVHPAATRGRRACSSPRPRPRSTRTPPPRRAPAPARRAPRAARQ